MLSAITPEAIQRIFNILSNTLETEKPGLLRNEADVALQCVVKIVHALHLNPQYHNEVKVWDVISQKILNLRGITSFYA